MHKLSKYRLINYLTVLFFLFTTITPGPVLAFHASQWHAGGTQVGPGINVEGQEPKDESQEEPILNPCGEGDPVYMHSGEFYYECSTLFIPGRGMDVDIRHHYRSGKNFNGQFGYGWRLNYYYRLKQLDNGNVMIIGGSGRKDEYTFEGGSSYAAPPGFYETLVQELDGTWTLTQKHGDKLIFDINGNITAMADRNGNQITFDYDPGGALPVIGVSPFTQNTNERVVLAYDHRLTRITDTAGRVINFSYNADGRLQSYTDHAGRTVTLAYDPLSDDLISITKPSSAQYPSGPTKTFSYDSAHRLTGITDARGVNFVTNHYDGQGRVYQQDLGNGSFAFNYGVGQTTVTDRNGFVTTYAFDASGHVIAKEEFAQGLRPGEPASYVTAYTYNTDGQLTSVTFPNGNGIVYVYDENSPEVRSRGNLIEVRRKSNMAQPDDDTNDLVTQITYEPNFNLPKRIIDPNGNMTSNLYDIELDPADPKYGTGGNVVKITYPAVAAGTPEGHFTYNIFGQVTERVDPNGSIARFEYFPATGYLKEVRRDPAGINAVTRFTYDNYGNISSVTDANGHATAYLYNELNWLIEETDPLNYKTKYTYDPNANVIKIERQADDAASTWQVTEFTYDVLNNLKTVKDPLNRVTTYNYDAGELLASVVDAELNTTQYRYDERDLLFKVTDANTPAGVTRYDYDDNGNLSRIVDANGNPTAYAYDGFDRLSTTTYADARFSRFDYDKNSNLVRHATPSTEPIEYDYDALDRRTNKRFVLHSGLDTSYNYDLGSRLTAASNAAGQLSFTYDALDRVMTSTQTLNSLDPLTLSYAYDKAGNRTQVLYPSGKSVEYTYDAHNRLDLVKVNAVTLVDYDHNPLDRRISKALTSNVSHLTSYAYDAANQLSILINEVPAGSQLSQYEYPSYDQVGNRLQMLRTYNKPPTRRFDYAYNDIYELVEVSRNQSHSYDYDNVANRVTADGVNYTKNTLNQYALVGSDLMSYDANGNLTNDGTDMYSYDEQNRLESMSSPAHLASYAYDAFNRRISKTVDGAKTYFIYDGDQVIEERNVSGSVVAEYVMGAGIDEVLTMERNNNTYYYHYDGLGSVTEITDNTGALIENYGYDPYGQPSVTTSAIGNPYMFTGRRWDEESNLYYYRARMYEPKIGRFLQRDPIGYADSMNLYQYGLNNSVNLIDPYGLDVYWININFGDWVPSNYYVSHSYIAITDKNKRTGRQEITEAFSWTNEKGGVWENPQRKKNLIGAQAAIDSGYGSTKIGDEIFESYVINQFNLRQNEKGGYYLPKVLGGKGHCKTQALNLIEDAIKEMKQEIKLNRQRYFNFRKDR